MEMARKFRMRAASMVVLLALFLVGACAHHSLSVDDVSGPLVWGSADSVMQIKHLYIAGQPNQEGMRQAQEAGVTTVINMRTAEEMNWDEKPSVESLGMKYINIPVSGKLDARDRAAFAEVEAAVEAQNGAPVLLHCASGNRASAWLGAHLNQAHGLSQAEALAIARKTGLTKSVLENRLQAYWGSSK